MSFKSLRFFLCLSLGTLSVPVFADNAVQMVTYFPVPYAAYNNVFVSQKFDVGTNTGNFTLDLGDASNCNEGISLRAENVNLAHITNNSALGFNTDIYTQSALFGNKNAKGPVTMKFNKLRINTLNADKARAVAEIDAKDVTVQGDMYMFEDYVQDAALPECTDAKWKNLQIGNKTGYYLVCGEGDTYSSDCPSSGYHWAAISTYDCVDKNGTNGWQSDWCDEDDIQCRNHVANIQCLGCGDTGGSGIECPNAYIYNGEIATSFVASTDCTEVASRTRQRYNIDVLDPDACCNSAHLGAVIFEWRENYGCYAYICRQED